MALFDNINSRYTQSMAEGGSYRRDAAEGGYDRKELRGLSKQAKSGSLTQRERARYNYLKKERKGRRKRGLLSGLGGAAALAGGLAAAGKLGGGSGGGGLMDSIKNRLQNRTERKAEEEQFNRRDANLQQELRDDNLASAIEGSEDKEVSTDIYGKKFQDTLSDIPLEEELTQDEGASSNMQEPSDMELYDEYGKSFDGLEGELRARNKASQVVQGENPTYPHQQMDMYYGYDPKTDSFDGRGRIGSKFDELAPGGSRENEVDPRDMILQSDPFGYGVERDIPAEGRPLTEAELLRSRMARRPGQPYDRSGLPDPEYRGNMEEGKMETLPGADGEEPTRGSNRPMVSQLLNRLYGVQQTGMPVRRDGPRAKFGMKVKTQKQEKLDRLRKFMKNRYR